jgi:hypothetical protein
MRPDAPQRPRPRVVAGRPAVTRLSGPALRPRTGERGADPATAVRREGRSVARLLALGWAAVGLVPLASGVSLIRHGWAPVFGERGTVAALTVDSIGLDPPLVGMPTSLGVEGGAPLSHPGPLGFWLLSIPTKLMGEPGHGLIVGTVAVAVLAIASLAALLRRRGDVRLEALALVLVAAMVASIGGAILADPFNPYLGILPLLGCLLAAWGVMSGHHRQLWVLVVAGSLAAQVHLGYVPLVATLVALVSVGIAADVVRSSGARRRRLTRRIIPVGVALGLIAWTGPIVDQLLGSRNLVRLWRSQSGDRPVAGVDHGLDLAVEFTSLPPRWLLGRAGDQVLADPSALRVALSIAAVALVVMLGIWAIRRRDRALASLSVVSVVSLVVATLSSARLVSLYSGYFDSRHLLLYRLFWWPVGMVFTLAVAWGTVRVVTLVRPPGMAADARDHRARVRIVAGVVAGVALIASLGYRSPPGSFDPIYRHDVTHAEAIADLPGSPEVVVLQFRPEGAAPPDGDIPEHSLSMGLVAQLRLRGIAVRFPDEDLREGAAALAYRAEHPATGDEPVVLLYRAGPDAHLDSPPGYRRISMSGPLPGDPPNPFSVPSTVSVRL